MDIRSHVVVDPFGQMLAGYRQAQKDSFDMALKREQIKNWAARTQSTLSATGRANALQPFALRSAAANAQDAEARGATAGERYALQNQHARLSLTQQGLNIQQSGVNLDRSRWQLGEDKKAAADAPGAGSQRLNLSTTGGAPVKPPSMQSIMDPFTASIGMGDDLAGQDRARAASEAKRAPQPAPAFEQSIGAGGDETNPDDEHGPSFSDILTANMGF